MSDLQIGLIALGALLIVVVLALNWWQDRRVRRQMEASFSPEREDPLLAGTTPAPVKTSRKARATSVQPPEMATRREPALNGAPAEDEPAAGMRREPEIEAVSSARDDGEPDLACEAIIELQFPAPVAARDLLPLVRELDRVGQKPLRTFFQTVDGSQTANLRLDRDYASMRLAVLLANRSGALTSAEWAQAWGRAERIAERFDARIEGPDPAHVAEHARQLDEICASFDTSVGLTLVPERPQPWRVAEILSLARDAGFTEGNDPDRLEWRDEDGAVRFTLVHPATEARGGAVAGRLNLILDVPRSPPSETAFADMARTARELADVLEAGVVDDNGLPLAEGSEDAVDTHLRRLYGQLAEHGLRAGSPRSLRVFA